MSTFFSALADKKDAKCSTGVQESLDAHVMSGEELPFEEEFDAVIQQRSAALDGRFIGNRSVTLRI